MSGCCCDGQSDPTVSESLANEEVTVRADGRGAEARCVQEIDAGASMLAMARCDGLAELLTEVYIATLKHNALRPKGARFEDPLYLAVLIS